MAGKLVIFIGGVSGVGKTTVISKIKELKPAIAFYDPGEMFDQYFLKNKTLDPKIIEKMVKISFKGLSQPITLVNWHYAVWKGSRLIPHLDWKYQKRLAQKMDPSDIYVFILLKADLETILKRRAKDVALNIKRRFLDNVHIVAEIVQEDKNFLKTINLFRKDGKGKVKSYQLTNKQSYLTAQKIIKIIPRRISLSGYSPMRREAGIFVSKKGRRWLVLPFLALWIELLLSPTFNMRMVRRFGRRMILIV
jgi:guanylate kinase